MGRFEVALRIANRERNEDRIRRRELVQARGASAKAWRNRSGAYVCVCTAVDAGVDSDEPWVASCDTHNEMLACPTKQSAVSAARSSKDWCSGCRK
jgi:hypothetical protein